MKSKYKNTGTKEFPFYTITVDGEYYCATDDVLKAKNLVRILTIPVVVGQSEQLRKCDVDKRGNEYRCLICGKKSEPSF
jgi:hypothetical protein|tara:strand:+ start:103 stop:339 length:237 start_codon:yes stop_codon:yes gene_type:complete